MGGTLKIFLGALLRELNHLQTSLKVPPVVRLFVLVVGTRAHYLCHTRKSLR